MCPSEFDLFGARGYVCGRNIDCALKHTDRSIDALDSFLIQSPLIRFPTAAQGYCMYRHNQFELIAADRVFQDHVAT